MWICTKREEKTMGRKMKTMDGNTAAAYVAYAFTDVAAIYPITPSSPMAESVDDWSAKGKKNIFGQEVRVIEMQSEAGAAGAVHGSLAAGALTTTFTASQGLLLMIPNMYKMSGELLPCVMHVSARALSTHALSIFGDHSDVMACRQTGFAMLASGSVQEVMDLAGVAHLSAIKGRVPFVHFFDGFRTSHEIQKIEVIEYEEFAKLLDHDAVRSFRENALNPDHPVLRGSAQNPDIYFQQRESANRFYQAIPGIVEYYMNEINRITGRNYALFNYYGAPDADRIIIAMGSVCDTTQEVVDYLNERGNKVGMVKVRLYRPFSAKHLLSVIPKTVKRIAVLDRTKEPGALGEPLYQDVCTAFFEMNESPLIVGGRYGLGSKDTAPSQIIAVFENLKREEPLNHFTIGIEDDVTHLSLPEGPAVDTRKPGTIACKFWGLGSDGTVGANKNSIKIIGDHTDMYVQAYFAYDSKKSGGITMSHLRFGKMPIRSAYLIQKADFVACHNPSYVDKFDMVEELNDNGTFLLNCGWDEKELDKKLPAKMKRYIANHNIQFYTIDAVSIGREIGLGSRINVVMQAAFFKLANIIPIEEAVVYMKEAIKETYGKKGDKVVATNYLAVEKGINAVKKIEIPESWKTATDTPKKPKELPEFIDKILEPMNSMKGEKLPVSTFVGREDGTFPQGAARYEKRGIAVDVPQWIPDNCIQCNQCSFVCPHAAIRPFLLTEEEVKNAPESFIVRKAIGKGLEKYSFRIQVTPYDCSGCGNCAQICPSKQKALVMRPIETQYDESHNWDYAMSLPVKENPMNKYTVKGSQFEQPLFEFSGACAGCGETPHIKIITQLFGDRIMVANATGCSSIYSGSVPCTPYCMNKNGHGPAWANSLFEDNAEYGLGMFLGVQQIRQRIADLCRQALEKDIPDNVKSAINGWLENFNNGNKTREVSANLAAALEGCRECSGDAKEILDKILEQKDFFVKRSQWIIGGDGWAYDIGFGGLDHVLASNNDVNVLVLDTEVYSNTGGQSSKATPTGAVAQFAASGKTTKKKDLGLIAMSYGYVYVAQVSIGADQAQFIRAVVEAENYPGPSLIIAYSPCINHGLRLGMGNSQLEAKNAVAAGYWHLYRYNPLLKKEGKNPFILDSKEPTASYRDFIMGEVRYSALTRMFPDKAEALFEQAEKEARERYEIYKKLSENCIF